MKKLLILLIIFAVVGTLWWKNQESQSDLPYGIAEVNGRIELKRLDISTLYAGRVEQFLVEEGELVEKGQVLVRLSSSQIEAQILSAKEQKKTIEEAVKRVEAEIKTQQHQVNLAKIELDNARKLRKEKLISQAELDKRTQAYKASLSGIDSLKAAQNEALARVNYAQSQIAQIEDIYKDLEILAPISGRVEYQIADLASVLPAGGRVLTLLDLNDVYLNVFLPAFQANKIKIADEARIVIDGIDTVFPAFVSFVASEAQFTPKSVETKTEREKLMFKIKLQIPPEIVKKNQNLMKAGMTAVAYLKFENVKWLERLEIKN